MVIQPAFAPLSCDFSAQFPGFSLLETLHDAWPNFYKQEILLCRRPWHFTELYLRFDPVDPRGLHCGRGVPTRFGPSQLQFFSSVPRLFSAGNIARYLAEFFLQARNSHKAICGHGSSNGGVHGHFACVPPRWVPWIFLRQIYRLIFSRIFASKKFYFVDTNSISLTITCASILGSLPCFD